MTNFVKELQGLQRVPCPLCQEMLLGEGWLVRHFATRHPELDLELAEELATDPAGCTCNCCGKAFTGKAYLRVHYAQYPFHVADRELPDVPGLAEALSQRSSPKIRHALREVRNDVTAVELLMNEAFQRAQPLRALLADVDVASLPLVSRELRNFYGDLAPFAAALAPRFDVSTESGRAVRRIHWRNSEAGGAVVDTGSPTRWCNLPSGSMVNSLPSLTLLNSEIVPSLLGSDWVVRLTDTLVQYLSEWSPLQDEVKQRPKIGYASSHLSVHTFRVHILQQQRPHSVLTPSRVVGMCCTAVLRAVGRLRASRLLGDALGEALAEVIKQQPGVIEGDKLQVLPWILNVSRVTRWAKLLANMINETDPAGGAAIAKTLTVRLVVPAPDQLVPALVQALDAGEASWLGDMHELLTAPGVSEEEEVRVFSKAVAAYAVAVAQRYGVDSDKPDHSGLVNGLAQSVQHVGKFVALLGDKEALSTAAHTAMAGAVSTIGAPIVAQSLHIFLNSSLSTPGAPARSLDCLAVLPLLPQLSRRSCCRHLVADAALRATTDRVYAPADEVEVLRAVGLSGTNVAAAMALIDGAKAPVLDDDRLSVKAFDAVAWRKCHRSMPAAVTELPTNLLPAELCTSLAAAADHLTAPRAAHGDAPAMPCRLSWQIAGPAAGTAEVFVASANATMVRLVAPQNAHLVQTFSTPEMLVLCAVNSGATSAGAIAATTRLGLTDIDEVLTALTTPGRDVLRTTGPVEARMVECNDDFRLPTDTAEPQPCTATPTQTAVAPSPDKACPEVECFVSAPTTASAGLALLDALRTSVQPLPAADLLLAAAPCSERDALAALAHLERLGVVVVSDAGFTLAPLAPSPRRGSPALQCVEGATEGHDAEAVPQLTPETDEDSVEGRLSLVFKELLGARTRALGGVVDDGAATAECCEEGPDEVASSITVAVEQVEALARQSIDGVVREWKRRGTDLDVVVAAKLLEAARWDVLKLAGWAAREDTATTLRRVSVGCKMPADATCAICLCDADNAQSLGCGHVACAECWAPYLRNVMAEPSFSALSAHCFGGCDGHCDAIVSSTVVAAALPAADAEVWHASLYKDAARSLVLSAEGVSACPCPSCGAVVATAAQGHRDNITVRCSCGATFCVGCARLGRTSLSHAPVSCSDLHRWLLLSTQGSAERQSLMRIKPCPNCQHFVSKCGCSGAITCDGMDKCPNAACDHMTCTMCKHEWCWICSGPYRGHQSEWHTDPRDEKERYQRAENMRNRHRHRSQEALTKATQAMQNGRAGPLKHEAWRAVSRLHQVLSWAGVATFVEREQKMLLTARLEAGAELVERLSTALDKPDTVCKFADVPQHEVDIACLTPCVENFARGLVDVSA